MACENYMKSKFSVYKMYIQCPFISCYKDSIEELQQKLYDPEKP